uniref:Pectin acetylesterase n=1 Tax=Alexandrium catenella TaxID=2925 RepID=A0A7S1KYR5_ALECA|mmetsp:Transcript_103279/g.274692  ORF Transcript_103279/g.274692 Transcript_103279/m.274692 type:complete len:461 (+) Transcript_103279:77-1459(+)
MLRQAPRLAALLLLPPLLLPSASAILSRGASERQSWRLPTIRMVRQLPQPEHSRCQVSPTNACTASSLPKGGISLVFPDPATSGARCLTSSKKEYGFQVVPRDPSKLLIWFQGGGACWNKFNTVSLRTCWRDQTWASFASTLFNESLAENPFKDFTVVSVTACTGDLHSGNATREYPDDSGAPVEQRGYRNTRSVVDWVKANYGEQTFKSLLIAGESAGAIGVQVWSRVLLSELRYERVSVVVDSYAAVFPPNFQGPVFKMLGVCTTPVLQLDDLQRKCDNSEITISDVFDATIRDFPRIPFVMLNSKWDSDQQMFYKVAADSMGVPTITPQEYHQQAVQIFRRYNKYPNVVFYQATNTIHVFLLEYVPFRRLNFSDLEAVPAFQKFVDPEARRLMMENYLQTVGGIQGLMAELPAASGTALRSYCEIRDDRHMAPFRGSLPVTSDSCEDDLANKTFVVP